jgi:hypothetical protein
MFESYQCDRTINRFELKEDIEYIKLRKRKEKWGFWLLQL